MKRMIQEPTMRHDSGSVGGDIYEHPAFAQISASRISGRCFLYGSDFHHNSSIRIRISGSTLRRSLSNDWAHEKSVPDIEVEMSEAQWAGFISNMNTSGTQCTLRQKDGQIVPEITAPIRRVEQFKAESDERTLRAIEKIKELEALIDGSKLSQKDKAELKSKANGVRQDIGVNQSYVASQFGEHMEKVVQHARIEINAYHENAVRKLGLSALAELQEGGGFYDPQIKTIEGSNT